jgi:PTH1 family peptidyl-tRNA hydrolase
MNLSGKAVRYWQDKLKADTSSMLILVDELAIPFGKIRIREKGSDAGHNGLKSIQELIGTQAYPRLRFGVGAEYPKGKQVEFVLGRWTEDEQKQVPQLIDHSVKAIESFALQGLERTMNFYNIK